MPLDRSKIIERLRRLEQEHPPVVKDELYELAQQLARNALQKHVDAAERSHRITAEDLATQVK